MTIIRYTELVMARVDLWFPNKRKGPCHAPPPPHTWKLNTQAVNLFLTPEPKKLS